MLNAPQAFYDMGQEQNHTMTIPWSRCVGHDNLDTAVWCVISSLPLFTIVVSYIIRILFVKLEY